ncbi:MAG: nucleotidyltransferase family protein [Pseudomonadota bacterium]
MSKPELLIRDGGQEFELMCLAARIEFGTAEAIRIRDLIAEGIDWAAFLAGVERNYVAPVVHRSLKSIDGASVPARVLDTLRVRSKITAFKSQLFAVELARLAKAFESTAIEVIHYKGAVTAQDYYGSVVLRNFNDLDFLVRRRDLPALFAMLETQGYVNSEQLTASELVHYVREFKEFLFTRGEISLEPHWSIVARRYPFETDYEGFWQRSRMLQLCGADLRVLSGEDSLLVLSLVGAKGEWKRLQMVTDVAACLRRFPELDWAQVQSTATATGTARILHLALLLAADLSGARLPESGDATMRNSATTRRLARQIVKSLAIAPAPPRFLPDSPSIFSPLLFRQRERYRDRWLYLWRTTTTPEPTHLRRFSLPGVAYPLYSLLVPLHDFVLFPAYQLAKLLFR